MTYPRLQRRTKTLLKFPRHTNRQSNRTNLHDSFQAVPVQRTQKHIAMRSALVYRSLPIAAVCEIPCKPRTDGNKNKVTHVLQFLALSFHFQIHGLQTYMRDMTPHRESERYFCVCVPTCPRTYTHTHTPRDQACSYTHHLLCGRCSPFIRAAAR